MKIEMEIVLSNWSELSTCYVFKYVHIIAYLK